MNDELRLKIEEYLGGIMSTSEATLFEQEMARNSELKEEVILQKQINHHLRDDKLNAEIPENEYTRRIRTYVKSDEAAHIKQVLKGVEKDYKERVKKPRRKNLMVAAILIGALLLSGIGYWYTSQATPQELYASYYSTNDLPSVIQRGDKDSKLAKGAVAFQENNFELALNYFSEYIESTSELDPFVYIYIGVINMEQGNIASANMALDNAIDSNTLDSSRGLWFKALTYLKAGDTENAGLFLKKLVESTTNFNYSKAKDLLEKL